MSGLKRVTFVTKPNSILRVALTIPVQWPRLIACVDAPPFEFPADASNVIGVFGVIHGITCFSRPGVARCSIMRDPRGGAFHRTRDPSHPGR